MGFSIFEITIISLFIIVSGAFLMLLRQLVMIFSTWKESTHLTAETIAHRTQAYERMMIFLERIKPAHLVTRFDKTLSPHEFIFLTEKSIAEEFHHNVAQQLYISQNAWQAIVHSKAKLLKLLHSTYENTSNDINLEDYKTLFLMNYLNDGDFISECIEELKKEFLILHLK